MDFESFLIDRSKSQRTIVNLNFIGGNPLSYYPRFSKMNSLLPDLVVLVGNDLQ
jgi:hypothetical protein